MHRSIRGTHLQDDVTESALAVIHVCYDAEVANILNRNTVQFLALHDLKDVPRASGGALSQEWHEGSCEMWLREGRDAPRSLRQTPQRKHCESSRANTVFKVSRC